jgi:protein-S-isoprenylcysteine O-methyltransferase Ste14
MRIVDLVIGVGWIAFWIYWLAASTNAKPGQGNWVRFAGIRVAIVVIVLLVLRLRLHKGHALMSITKDPVLWGVGLGIWVLGLGLAIWARIYTGRDWGMPMSRKEDPDLVTTGPYRTIRHPIYTGILLGMIGTTIAVSLYWLIAVVVLGGYFIYSAFVEERNMTKLFPGAYPKYKQSTKMLIPFIF